MADDIDEKVAVLFDRSEDSKEFQVRVLAELQNLHYDVKAMPGKLHQQMDNNYVTRREFKAVKAVFTSIATLLSVLVGIFTYFRN